jgi:hypothetical protein
MTPVEALTACGAFRALHPKLYQVAIAIQEHEGFYPRRGATRPGSKAWRNNNPGNLRKSALVTSTEVDGFAVFESYYEGLLALLLDLQAKAVGRTTTGLGPLSTLRALITVWAPPTDNNDTEAYIRAVALRVNAAPEATLASLLWS